MKMNRRGFTMIELMIVVVIVGILAAVAYPAYTSHVSKGHQAVAKSALEAVRLAMENFRSKQGRYLEAGRDVNSLPGYEGTMWEGATPNRRYTLTIQESNANSFILRAICQPPQCNIDDDETADILELDHLGRFTVISNDLEN